MLLLPTPTGNKIEIKRIKDARNRHGKPPLDYIPTDHLSFRLLFK